VAERRLHRRQVHARAEQVASELAARVLWENRPAMSSAVDNST
jgi:hypothetical protein